jgi:uncharacterized membrane protein YozB (DUF420 family)
VRALLDHHAEDMSGQALRRTATRTPDVHRTPARTGLLRRPWIAPVALLTVIFVASALPPYLSLDPALARLQPMPAYRAYYPLLVTHIFLGSLVLLAACFQVWPWLRRTHPAVHRWSGRIYVAAALSASACVMIIAPMGLHGANQQVANTMLAALWFGTTLAGFRAIRQRRFAAHRRWMLRSVALSFSIVANRIWLAVAFAVFVPEIYTGAELDPVAVDQAIGASAWISWVANLLIIEWWLQRHPAPFTSANRSRQVAASVAV